VSERERALQNIINAIYRFESDIKDYNLWLTKVDVVLNRYSQQLNSDPSSLTSDPGVSMDATQHSQLTDSLKVCEQLRLPTIETEFEWLLSSCNCM